jgi:hypothetical protein
MANRLSNPADEKGVSNMPFISLLALVGLLVYGEISSISAELTVLLDRLLGH